MFRLALPIRVVAWCTSVAVPCLAAAQVQPWRNDWTIQAVPSLQYAGTYAATTQSPVAFSPDGEFVLRAPSQYLDDQIVRFDSSGNVRWRVNIGNIGGTFDALYGVMLANADGSAYVAVQQGIALAKIDPAGAVAWSQAFDPLYLAATAQGVVAQDCNSVAAFDAAGGNLLWQHNLAAATGCAGNGVVTDAAGAAYASFNIAVGSANDTHVMKFDASGTLVWDIETSAGIRRVVGVSGNQVYVSDPSGGSALSTADGSVQWTTTAGPVGLGGSPAELIAYGGGGLQRLNAADGSARWLQPVPSNFPRPMFCSAGNKAVYGASRIDLDTGAIDFTVTLPDKDAYGNYVQYFSVMCSGDGSSTFAAASYESTLNAAATLQRVDNSGALLGTVPIAPGARSVATDNILVAGATIVSISLDSDAHGSSVAHLRGVDRNTGSTLWQTDLAPPGFLAPYYWPVGGLGANAGTIAVTLATGESDQQQPAEGVWVYSLDSATGATRWSKYLYLVGGDPNYYQLSTVSTDPLVDAQGNVLVPYTAEVYEYHSPFQPGQHTQASVVKLSAADGSIVWQHDEVSPSYPAGDFTIYNAPPIFLLGSDVLLAGGFAYPNTADSVVKLSGADGSVLWRSNVFSNTPTNYIGSVNVPDDGDPIVYGSGWAKLDAQTGATLWSNAYTEVCHNICVNGGGSVMLPNGDLYGDGENYSRAEITFVPGHANATVASWLFDQQDTHLRQSFFYTLERDSNGALWARLQRNYRYYNQRSSWLVRFDPASGALVTQQALSGNEYLDPLLPLASAVPLAAPENNLLLASSFTNAPPAPNTTGVALLDTTIRANGDLSITVGAGRDYVQPGDSVAFHLTVNYSGDAAISGARLLADFPWLGKATGVACATQAASNCVLDQRTGTLLASFDIQPGGRIDVTGSAIASTAAKNAPLSAFVIGPTALNELDPSNNASWIWVESSIFRDGFE